MKPDLKTSMQISSSLDPVAENIANIFSAEKTIAALPPEGIAQLRKQISLNPANAFLRLWHGLVLLNQKQWETAIQEFQTAIHLGCHHWRVLWYLAKSARGKNDLNLVDRACSAVLKENPQFWFARELPKHARGYYAQLQQDKFIEKFFRDQPPQSKVFVEVGAFDGMHYSNVRRLHERYGWTGICIEPVRKNYAKLVESYRSTPVICVQAAAGNAETCAEMHVSTYPHLPEWGSDVASLSTHEVDRWTGLYGAHWTREQVVVKKLTSILDDYSVTGFDLLSVDAENHGLEVLEGLDFKRFQPQLICIEYGRQRQSIINYLAQRGYSVCLDNGQDLFLAQVNLNRLSGHLRENAPATVNYTGLSGLPPYTEIQKDVENNIHSFIEKSPADLRCIVIVGGYLGYEVDVLLKNYPNAAIHIFEPSQRYFSRMSARFAGMPRVECHNYAVGDRQGVATFYEGSLAGIGSLLPLKTKAGESTWIPPQAAPAESYAVNVVTLDGFEPLNHRSIDLLWCDVQGAELKVLKGARNMLRRCHALFLEIALSRTTYHGQSLLSGLQRFLAQHRFHMAGIGLCRSGNSTGNSLWLRCGSQKQKAEPAPLTASQRSEAAGRLNPHLLSLIPIGKATEILELHPRHLLNPKRFDLTAKYIYGLHRHLNLASGWARELYLEHIRVWNGCNEADGAGKNGAQAFLDSFDRLLDSIRDSGFDDRRSLVPIDRNNLIIDGAHRVAACLLYNCNVTCVRLDIRANEYGSEFFKQNTRHVAAGLSPACADAMALEYCKLNPDTYIVAVFPAGAGHDQAIRKILLDCGAIVHEKQVRLFNSGPLNLIRQIYSGEPWLGGHQLKFAGACRKARACFPHQGPLRVYVLESRDLSDVTAAKAKLRRLFNIGNDSVHINDRHDETIRAAQILFNANSIHFMNYARPNYFDRFYQLVYQYRDWLERYGLDPDYFCVDGSAVMSAYGIRPPQDLDYLHHGYEDMITGNPQICSHNSDAHHHVTPIDDILFNPRNHFFFDGVKFASLGLIRAMKNRRGEPKDRQDVKLIDALGTDAAAASVAKTDPAPVGKSASRRKIVGLISARNEAKIIAPCLQALSYYTDAIVFLDDASEDDTVRLVKAMAAEYNIETIIEKGAWHRNEPADRNALLQAGRKIAGTHFIVLDADEMFTANCAGCGILRNRIAQLQSGDKLILPWIQLWRGIDQYRADDSVWAHNHKAFIFCDDGNCCYASDFIHTARVPENLAGKPCLIAGNTLAVMHFQFVNWRNMLVKQAWYRCLERLRRPDKSAVAINRRYAPSKDETNMRLKNVPAEWFAGYDFFKPDAYHLPDTWREQQVLEWFRKYGEAAFADLDIWDIDWGQGLGQTKTARLQSANQPTIALSS